MAETALTVPDGLYFGFTQSEVEDELERYKKAVKTASDNSLTGSSVNGQSFSFGPNRDLSLPQWRKEIQEALAVFGVNSLPCSYARATF